MPTTERIHPSSPQVKAVCCVPYYAPAKPGSLPHTVGNLADRAVRRLLQLLQEAIRLQHHQLTSGDNGDLAHDHYLARFVSGAWQQVQNWHQPGISP